jgi:hypothetical protein
MTTLIIAEHDGAAIKPATLNTIAAAVEDRRRRARAGRRQRVRRRRPGRRAVAGVAKVLHADAAALRRTAGRNVAALVLAGARRRLHARADAGHGLRQERRCRAWPRCSTWRSCRRDGQIEPLLLDQQLTEDERMVRDTARAYCQDKLAPRVLEAFRHEKTDPAIFREMGELGLLGPPSRAVRRRRA